MQPRTPPALAAHLTSRAAPTDRVIPFITLADYTAGGLIHETSEVYDGGLRFGPVEARAPTTCPAQWLGERVRAAAKAAAGMGEGIRPILIQAPSTTLDHANTVSACSEALAGQMACSQEVCLVYEDAALVAAQDDALPALGVLRSHGFRIGVNAMRSWSGLASPALALLIDCVWVNPSYLDLEEELGASVSRLHAEGVQTIGCGMKWSEAARYAHLGLTHVFKGQPDA